MKKKFFDWRVAFGIILVLLSIAFYFLHYLIFHNPHHIFLYLIGDIAFVFIQVLLVTLVLERFWQYNEAKERMEKLYMLIGAFFSEVGHKLLDLYSRVDLNAGEVIKDVALDGLWSDDDFKKFQKNLHRHKFLIDASKINLEELRNFLIEKRDFLLRLIENPNLLEHEKFTNLLLAVFHLTEELQYRKDFRNLPEADYEHISKDIIRIYNLLLEAWIKYAEHLKENYPYLFSLVIRINPFNPKATVVIK
ncbi:MAG: hypothetical protein ABIL40_07170 [candidate division WOR-3 bacterium]